MIYGYFIRRSSVRLMHSPDLDDMRRAIAEDDQDGPGGGSPDIRRLSLAPDARPGATAK